eukprot:14298745-Alexandrium_andersonii.AAC.1
MSRSTTRSGRGSSSASRFTARSRGSSSGLPALGRRGPPWPLTFRRPTASSRYQRMAGLPSMRARPAGRPAQ